MGAVQRSGQADNTLTLLTGDNGGYVLTPDWLCHGTPAPGGTNGALRCGKGTTYEGGHRLPGIAHWPGRIAPGSVTSQLASHLDVLPTLCALAAGCELPKKALDGVDIAPLLFAPASAPEPPSPRRAFFYYATGDKVAWDDGHHVPLMAARVGVYKAHFWTSGWGAYGPWYSDAVEMSAGLADPACHAPLAHHDPPLLYNVDRDVGEYVPIGNDTAEYRTAMRTILAEVASHNRTMEYRGADPTPPSTPASVCYRQLNTNKTNCFPCASMECEPKPMCCSIKAGAGAGAGPNKLKHDDHALGSHLPGSLKWFSFYGFNASEQHTFSNLGQSTNADALAAAWSEYKMPGMLDVEDLHIGSHCPPRGCFKDGLYHRMWSNESKLNGKWQDILGTALAASKDALDSGAIKGFFLGALSALARNG